MIIRDETPRDKTAVGQVVVMAFDQRVEADLVDALRGSGDAVISLVAEDEGQIVGHVMFSKLQAPGQCIALAPVSVMPNRQMQGIGSDLIGEGLARAKRDNWQAVFVLGEPEYYQRFGFSVGLAEKFETAYPKPYFMALELEPSSLSERSGAVIYALPFQALD
jgi:putative acetyltransferase